jgi:NADP-dependent 3-hydroxy acid dehydrogenase YdfG
MFAGKVALVTGASSGIGKATGIALWRSGATVWMVARNVGKLEEVAREIGASERLRVHGVDLLEDEEVRALGRAVAEEAGQLDVLVHAAGVIAIGPVESAPVADFDLQWRTNVRAPYLLTQVLLPQVVASRGQIVFVNSSAGRHAAGNVAQYAATKHALKAVADSLREEVNPLGLRVLSVYAGRTATPMQASLHRLEGRNYAGERLLQPEDVAEAVLGSLTLARTAEVTDLHIRSLLKPL